MSSRFWSSLHHIQLHGFLFPIFRQQFLEKIERLSLVSRLRNELKILPSLWSMGSFIYAKVFHSFRVMHSMRVRVFCFLRLFYPSRSFHAFESCILRDSSTFSKEPFVFALVNTNKSSHKWHDHYNGSSSCKSCCR